MKRTNNLARRSFCKAGALLPIATGISTSGKAALSAAAVPASGVYERLGVRTFINAVGTLTTLSGSLLPHEVAQAMDEASRHFVAIHELQDRDGKRLVELTGAQAAF